ncbi:helix-turn-helix domain-containing protein [Agrobacterium rosae]|uniref:Putative transcriptional regulator n=1 Tax=Agrobacterium rosae TaxID=1972867 RepID=A0A1R3TSU1_9HYPH|nr:helix-turn-helix transcriptional regulator [Agrobacterium rosae]SCX23144.1 putative transcriptional regulator [Agrobacterium rosae]
MAIGKLFIGRKIRELRDANRATQAQFAERIGISTSYLNQNENDQRPVSAAVLVAPAEKFQINMSELSSGEGDRLLSTITEALTDPLFENLSPSFQELKLITQSAPNLARAFIQAHQGYKRNNEQFVGLSDSLGRSASLAETTPYEEVRDFFHFVDNYIYALDIAAEKLASELGLGDGDNYSVLSRFLKSEDEVEVRRSEAENDALRRLYRSSGILSINRYAPASTRDFQIAFQIAQLHIPDLIQSIAQDANFRTVESVEICKIGLQNYFAGALILFYGEFLSTANRLRHDIDLLAARFGASVEQVCHRLSTLQRAGNKGVPVFFARIDRAGDITKRHSSTKLQFARFGAVCPLWNVHEAFKTQGRIIRQLAETPDGVRYLCLATQITKSGAGYHSPQPRYAIAFGCEISYAHAFVYADDLDRSARTNFASIGISCRICERPKCPQRAVPPLMRELRVDHDTRTILPYTLGDR